MSLFPVGEVSAAPTAFIRDTEVENTIRGYATPIFLAAGLDPTAVRIYLVNDKQINAFVAGGQNLFINTGLLMQSEDAGQVIGIIAHEAGHIAGGHLVRVQDALSRGTAESILSMVLGTAAAVAGAPQVGAAVISGGQNVALRNYLHYTQTQEGSADAAAMRFLDATHQSARGLLDFFHLLSGQELLIAVHQDPYLRTHPLTEDRIQALEAFVAKSPYSDVPVRPSFQAQHRRMLAKLHAFLDDPVITRRRYPDSDQSLEARYAHAIVEHRQAHTSQAITIIDQLISEHPDDPYFYELKGQILFESGQPVSALEPYEKAVAILPDAPLIRVDLARVQMATNDAKLLPSAIENLQTSLRQEPNRPFVWRQLAIALGRNGQMGESSLALAEESMLLNKLPEAKFHAGKAVRDLPAGSPAWLKAEDILQVAENAKPQ
ncbi:MAG: M48 family metallopeptidase [Rhodospirillales bacterium]|nr:M48 family metallopeptidase [Rhodospirillales bacterium]